MERVLKKKIKKRYNKQINISKDRGKMKLLIVESPNKANYLNKILNHNNTRNFNIIATCGHIENLVDNSLSIEEKTYYPIIEAKRPDIIKKIRQVSAYSDIIYLATDPDREGESIAYSVYRHLPEDCKKRAVRISFKSMFEIKQSFNSGKEIDLNLVKSQMARRVLDRLIGFGLTIITRRQIQGDYTVGRVQTPILGQISKTTLEYMNHTPQIQYNVYTVFDIYGSVGAASLYLQHNQVFDDISHATAYSNNMNAFPYTVVSISKTQQSVQPSLPLNTYSLIRNAYNFYGMNANTTMQTAQKLFENGYITYPRTESQEIDNKTKEMIKNYVFQTYGKDYISSDIVHYPSSSLSHTSILPTSPSPSPDNFRNLSKNEQLLYQLIFNHAVTSVMSPAIIDIYDIVLKNKNGKKVVLKSSDLVFDGWSRNNPDELVLPYQPLPYGFKQNMVIKKGYTTIQRQQTQPPPLLNDASIVKLMQEKGIGRPSTVSTVIKNLVDNKRNYVDITSKGYKITEKGQALIDFLKNKYPSIVNTEYTKQVEEVLDDIAKGKREYTPSIHQLIEEIKRNDGVDLSPETLRKEKIVYNANMEI